MITGSSSGIGAACAAGFAEAGDTVIATVRDLGHCDELRQLVAPHRSVTIEGLDVTDRTAAEALIASVYERHGRIDVLVNNAGIGTQGTLEELSIADLERSMAVNFWGVVYTTKAALTRMRAHGGGRIVAVTSLGGVLGQPFNDAYCAAKFAVEGLYESLHPVARHDGVHVTIFEPGPVDTDFRAKSLAAPRSPVPTIRLMHERYEAMMASGRAGQPAADVARQLVELADEAEPRLRYQSSSFTSKLAGLKLSDLNGERVIGLTSTWIAD